MGKIIKVDFKKKSKKRDREKKESVDFPMVFHESGWGINPTQLKKIHVSQTGSIFFYFTKTSKEPHGALCMPNYDMACEAAEQLQHCIYQEYGIEVKVIYE